jgi:hypothetical protein
VATVTIDSSGNVSNSVIDTLEFDTSNGLEPSLIQVSSTVYAVAYRGVSNDGFITTFTIDSSGNISNSVVDTLEYDTSDGYEPSLVYVTDSVYAIAFRGPSSDGFIKTVTIDSSGNISNAIVDSLEYDTSDGYEPSLLQLSSSVYAVAYRGASSDGFVKTFTIDSSGNISNSVVDNLEFDTADGTKPSLVYVTGSVYAIAYTSVNNDGFVVTVTIDSSTGDIGNTVVDSLEFDTSNGEDCSLVRVTTSVYAIAYQGASGDGFVSTLSISSSGDISSAVIDSYEFNTADGEQLHLVAVGNNTYTVGYTGTGSDGFIDTIQILTRRGVFKGAAYGLDADTATGLAMTEDQTISTTLTSGWNHLALTYDKDASSSQQKLYVNGSLATSATLTGAMTTNSNDLFLGQYFDGQIDEIRLSSGTVRSAAWIATEYANMNGSSVVTVGSEENFP